MHNDSCSSISGALCFRNHKGIVDGRSRRQGQEKRLLFIFILASPCRHSSLSIASLNYVQMPDRAQIRALSFCSRVLPGVVPELHQSTTTSGTAVCQLRGPPGRNLSSCMGLLSQHACICLQATERLRCFAPRPGHIVFSTDQHGWDYTAAGLATQSKTNRLLIHSVAASTAAKCLATFLSTAQTQIGLSTAAHGCFSVRFSALHGVFILLCVHQVDSLLRTLYRCQKLHAGARVVNYLIELPLLSTTTWLWAKAVAIDLPGVRTPTNPGQPWAALPAAASQSHLGVTCSHISWEANFMVAFLSLSSR